MALERCLTGIGYQIRLVLQGIYERKDSEEARKLFRNWCAWVRPMRWLTRELLEPMARAARMVKGQLDGILALWPRGQMTTFMQGLNSLFSDVKRKAGEYWTVESMTAMLFVGSGKLTVPCH
jgi:hypothetical protein